MISEADPGGFARTIIETEIKIEINAKSSFRQAGFSRELNNPASFPYRSRNISRAVARPYPGSLFMETSGIKARVRFRVGKNGDYPPCRAVRHRSA